MIPVSRETRLLGALLSDPSTEASLSDGTRLRTYITIETALARVQEQFGTVPEGTAGAVERAGMRILESAPDFSEATRQNGTVVPSLVDALRLEVGPAIAPHVHRGATSQDLEDTASVLQIRAVLDEFETRLQRLSEQLRRRALEHETLVMAARTRTQQATPTTFGLKLATWREPLERHRVRLRELRPRLLVVQLGGASGTLSAMGSDGIRIMERMARELDLAAPALPWHTQRDTFAELAGWLSLLTGSLGKIGLDLALLSQSEVGETRPGRPGVSSAMPHKANPVAAETLVALGRRNAELLSSVHQAALQEHERSGAGLTLEWMALPDMLRCTGAALRHAADTLNSLEVDAGRMRRNLDLAGGIAFAEAARAFLAPTLGEDGAARQVDEAVRRTREEGRDLLDVLGEQTGLSIPRDPLEVRALGLAREFLRRAVDPARRR